MQNFAQHLAHPPAIPFVNGLATSAAAVPARQPGGDFCRSAYSRQADTEFVQMLDGFRSSGGLARLREVSELCALRGGPSIDMLATSLARKEIICVEWQSQGWLPLFQFDPVDMTVRPQIQPVVAELSCIYSPWDLAFWFSQPNAWLGCNIPADSLLTDLDTVVQAARADRFVASG